MNDYDDLCDMADKIHEAVLLLEKNIDTVPPHGCQRDEVLRLLKDALGYE